MLGLVAAAALVALGLIRIGEGLNDQHAAAFRQQYQIWKEQQSEELQRLIPPRGEDSLTR